MLFYRVLLTGSYNGVFTTWAQDTGRYILLEVYSFACLQQNLDMLSSCILKPLKTIAVLQYYCLRQICEPEIEVPHKERSFFYLNSESLCYLLAKFFSPVVLQNPFLLPALPVTSLTGSSPSHRRLLSLCAVWLCSPVQ